MQCARRASVCVAVAGGPMMMAIHARRFVPQKREEVLQLAQCRLASRLALVPMFSDLSDGSMQATRPGLVHEST